MADPLEIINKYLIDISEEGDEHKREERKETMLTYLKGTENDLALIILQDLFRIDNKIEKFEQEHTEFINEIKKDIKDVTEKFKMFNLARRLPNKK